MHSNEENYISLAFLHCCSVVGTTLRVRRTATERSPEEKNEIFTNRHVVVADSLCVVLSFTRVAWQDGALGRQCGTYTKVLSCCQ